MKKRLLSLWMALCILLIPLTACVQQQQQSNAEDGLVYESYKDIPGITAEEIAGIDAILQSRDHFVYAMNYSTEAFWDENGEAIGFSRMFCDELSHLFGVPFELKICQWDELMTGLNNYEIDFTGELTPTSRRLDRYYMTETIARRSLKVFRLEDSEQLFDIRRNRTPEYAFLVDATAQQYVKEAEDGSFHTTLVGGYAQAVDLLRSGEIDAFFDYGTAEAAFEDYPDIRMQNYYPVVYDRVGMSTKNPELLLMISVMQKYLRQGTSSHLAELYTQGEELYKRQTLRNQFTEEELAYLAQQGDTPIFFAAEFDNYPMSFYNDEEQQWQGMAHDVLAEISEMTGLVFQPANTEKLAWAQLQDMLDRGEVALVTELIPSDDRQGEYLWPEEPYCTDNYALISLESTPDINLSQILYASVAYPTDSAYGEVFEKWFPDHQNTVAYPTSAACYEALEAGEVDFVMGSQNRMLSVTNYQEKSGFKLNLVFEYPVDSYLGLHSHEEILCGIISKTQSFIDVDKISDHWQHKLFDYRSKMARAQVPYLIAIAVSLTVVLTMALVLLYRNKRMGVRLEDLVNQRTAELEVQTRAAQVASQAKGDFLSRMSHEMRTPLNAIIGMGQVMEAVPDLPDKARDTNQEITNASHHLLELINDVLDMAKIESGKFVLAEKPFALRDTMQEIADMLQQQCQEKQLRFSCNCAELPALTLLGDRLRLKQILINLLGNAVKFTDAGGAVSFQIHCEEEETAARLSFLVQDNGIGMSPEQQKRVFGAFEQADQNTTTQYGGTGLGLAISQNMVRMMGGEIMLESSLGQGSKFRVDISCPKAEHMQQAERDEFPTEFDFSGKCMLLVEDILINRMIIQELLGDTGIEIVEAEDGQRAVELFAESPEYGFDIVFMDVQMPRLDGYGATRALRALPRADAKTTPIIAMTANAYREDVEKAIESGMNEHMSKPVDLSMILQILHRYLS